MVLSKCPFQDLYPRLAGMCLDPSSELFWVQRVVFPSGFSFSVEATRCPSFVWSVPRIEARIPACVGCHLLPKLLALTQISTWPLTGDVSSLEFQSSTKFHPSETVIFWLKILNDHTVCGGQNDFTWGKRPIVNWGLLPGSAFC